MMKNLQDLIDDLRLNHEFCPKEVILRAADELEKYKWDVHSCGPTCTRYACVAMREAVQAEREACAKVCDRVVEGKDPDDIHDDSQWAALTLAAEIRARSNT